MSFLYHTTAGAVDLAALVAAVVIALVRGSMAAKNMAIVSLLWFLLQRTTLATLPEQEAFFVDGLVSLALFFCMFVARNSVVTWKAYFALYPPQAAVFFTFGDYGAEATTVLEYFQLLIIIGESIKNGGFGNSITRHPGYIHTADPANVWRQLGIYRGDTNQMCEVSPPDFDKKTGGQ